MARAEVSNNTASAVHHYYSADSSTRAEWEAAAAQFALRATSPVVIDAACAMQHALFNETTPPASDSMIAVHIRWGDKIEPVSYLGGKPEMPKVAVVRYVQAIEKLCERHRISAPAILLATQEAPARAAFMRAAKQHPHWTVHELHAGPLHNWVQAGIWRNQAGTAEALRASWLTSLASLLVLLQARHFVLVRGSNWSRLIDHLRRTRMNALCSRCTSMVDLSEQDV